MKKLKRKNRNVQSTEKAIEVEKEIINQNKKGFNFNTFFGFKGYVIYLYSDVHLNGKMFPLLSKGSVLEIESEKEIFLLDSVSFYLDGKPVYFVVKNFPISINLKFHLEKIGVVSNEKFKLLIEQAYERELKQLLKKLNISKDKIMDYIDKKKEQMKNKVAVDTKKGVFIREGYSSSDIHAKVKSIYAKKWYGTPNLQIMHIVLWIMSILLSIIGTLMFTMLLPTPIGPIPSNSTGG